MSINYFPPKYALPHIAASDSTNQYATASNTPTLALWNTLDSSNQFVLNMSGSATAEITGVYKITYSLQFVNTDNAIHNVAVWLRVNTLDVPNSSTIFSVPARKSVGNNGYLCAYSEVVFKMNPGDDVELYWATEQAYVVSPLTDGVYMEALPAQNAPYARPATPSAIGSITFVSTL